jgi:arginase family enzyme
MLGVANGYGAPDPACQDGPEVLRALRFPSDLEETRNSFHWDEPIRNRHPAARDTLAAVEDIAGQLADRAGTHVQEGSFPLVIGGDHSCAIGTWAGVKRALGAEARLGLVWIDAHMDSHTFDSSPSKQIHGMPLACLFGVGDPRLTGIAGVGAKLLPQDVCLIGVRSFESEEASLLKRLATASTSWTKSGSGDCMRSLSKRWLWSANTQPATVSASISTPLIPLRNRASEAPSREACYAPT